MTAFKVPVATMLRRTTEVHNLGREILRLHRHGQGARAVREAASRLVATAIAISSTRPRLNRIMVSPARPSRAAFPKLFNVALRKRWLNGFER